MLVPSFAHRFSNQIGLSLTEVMFGLGIAGVVSLGVTEVMTQQVRSKQEIQKKLDMNSNFQFANGVASTLRIIGDDLLTTSTDRPMLERCFSGRTKTTDNCTPLAVQAKIIERASSTFSSNGFTNSSQVTATIHCTNTRCSSVEVRTLTTQAKQGEDATRFETVKSISGYAFAKIDQVDFSCAANGMVSGIEFQSRDAVCNPLTNADQTQCVQSAPLRSFGTNLGCQAMANVNCAPNAGITQVGVFQGNSNCTLASFPW